ncbi:sulfatase [Stieleria sp. TO1_6]|uniref:sulfatase family protein n=1 Tax=Stieleria tagensis TaxID=2956795 RepID=UPI00209A8ACF|nr:sulfatase [Stieleria tagensis]MCO8121367.1 sulfatase [Stieleria tagensis]
MTSLRTATLFASLLLLLPGYCRADDPPNLLVITVDDMSCDSVGAFGCQLADTTPNIDALAASGMRYQYAHVQVGNCYPSRNVMFSGRYPHNTGVEGFYQVKNPDYPHLVDLMKQRGYFVGIRGKVSHSTPYQPYAWDADLTILNGKQQDMKNADSYYASTRRGIELAQQANKPFCLNINISDPHKPFYAMGKSGKVIDDPNRPSRVFTPAEVPIPGFLFDDPDVRVELAHYYSSVRRADDCVAAVMRALGESDQDDDTVVVFLSDHGMPLPFAKTALWHHSTHTPWIVRWPGVTEPSSIDTEHMISAVDLLPTLVEIAGIKAPGGFDGRSFLPTLQGQDQSGRDFVFKVYNENSGGNRSPMRSVQSKRFGYLFNPWSDGKRVFRTATTGTMTYRAMQRLAANDESIAARLEFFQHGVPEEFYDYENDPDALHNLIDDPHYAQELAEHRAAMLTMMQQSGDPLLDAFEHRNDKQRVSDYVDKVQAESDARRQNKRKQPSASRRSQPAQNAKLFRMSVPDKIESANELVAKLTYELPSELGTQKFHVTLKDGAGKRIERIVKSAAGNGTLEFRFKLPATSDRFNVAAFVGEDFATNRLHRTAGPIITNSASPAETR